MWQKRNSISSLFCALWLKLVVGVMVFCCIAIYWQINYGTSNIFLIRFSSLFHSYWFVFFPLSFSLLFFKSLTSHRSCCIHKKSEIVLFSSVQLKIMTEPVHTVYILTERTNRDGVGCLSGGGAGFLLMSNTNMLA